MSSREEVEAALQKLAARAREPAAQEKIRSFKRDVVLTFNDLSLSYLFKPQVGTFESLTVQRDEKNSVEVVTDAETFLGILNGKVDGVAAFARGKIKVHGSISDLLKLQQLLRQF